MEFTIREKIAQPMEAVWSTYRDRLPDLVRFLPNVTSIDVIERNDENPDEVHLLNEWCVAGAMPKVVRRFIKEEMLRYKDHADWYWPQKRCAWRNEFPALPNAVTCEGENHYTQAGDACEIEIQGRLSVDLGRVPGVPRMFGRFGSTVESFIIGRIKPNLVEVCRAVEKLLAEES